MRTSKESYIETGPFRECVQAIDNRHAKRMQTIQELLTRGLDLDFNALGEILRVKVAKSIEIAAESILAFCATCFFPPGCEQASVLWLAAANNDLEAFLERAASWVPAVFCWSCQHKQCRQGEETKGILVSRTHYVCLPIPFFTSQEIQDCLFLRTAHQSSDLFEDRFDALCIEENIVGSFRFSIYHFFPTKISHLAKDL